MKKIVFIWSGVTHEGIITDQKKHSVLGMVTYIDVVNPAKMQFTIFGKCEVGNCGPYKVISIKDI